jgi:hypothetical protein
MSPALTRLQTEVLCQAIYPIADDAVNAHFCHMLYGGIIV